MATMSEHFKQVSRAESFKRDQHNTLSQLADLLTATEAQRRVRAIPVVASALCGPFTT